MNSLVVRARFKFALMAIFIATFIFITTNLFSSNLIYQIAIFLSIVCYYAVNDRQKLTAFIGFTRFLAVVIVILHLIFFLFKGLYKSWDFALEFYSKAWISIVVRIFIIPNIFAFFNILISKVGIIDIMLISRNSPKMKIIYILFVAGIEVMERLRIHYEHHPENSSKRWIDIISHYLAVPLTLFFGIFRGFENRHKLLLERELFFKEGQI